MVGDVYRNSLAGAMRHLTERRARIPTLSPLRHALLDDGERASLETLAARVDSASRGDVGSMGAFEGALERLEQTVEAMRRLTQERLHECGRVTVPAHRPAGSKLDLHLLVGPWMATFGGTAAAWGSSGAAGRFETQGVRLLLALEGSRVGICGRLRTAAPLALARVRMARRAFLGSGSDLEGGTQAILLGEPRFDRAFAVDGGLHAARALLTEPIREALLGLDTVPSLTLEGGIAELRWDVATPETRSWRPDPNPWRQRSQVRIENLVPESMLNVAVAIARALDEE